MFIVCILADMILDLYQIDENIVKYTYWMLDTDYTYVQPLITIIVI